VFTIVDFYTKGAYEMFTRRPRRHRQTRAQQAGTGKALTPQEELRRRKRRRAARARRARGGVSLKVWKGLIRKINLGRARLKRYGLAPEAYDLMLAEQGGVCAICRGPEVRTFHVDHDHLTGRVRGILCASCNHVLGRMKDDPALLRAAAAYLERLS